MLANGSLNQNLRAQFASEADRRLAWRAANASTSVPLCGSQGLPSQARGSISAYAPSAAIGEGRLVRAAHVGCCNFRRDLPK